MSEAHVGFLNQGIATRGALREVDFEPLTLQGAVVDVQATWFAARVNVRQEFKNEAPSSVKAFAALPVPAGWSVVAYRAEVENYFAMTEIKERDVQVPQTTAPEVAPTVFTGDIPKAILAGQSCIVTITYVAPLSVIGTDGAELTIPKDLVVGRNPTERLEAGSWKKAFVVPGLSRLTESLITTVRGQTYSPNLDPPRIAQFSDASAKLLGDTRGFEVKFEARNETLKFEEDVVVNFNFVKYEDPITMQAVKETAEGFDDRDRYALGFSLCPQFSNEQRAKPNCEVVFLVDCSGSMQHGIESVRRALKVALKGLPQSSFFNIVLFGSTVQSLFPESQLADAASVAEALEFAEKIDANMGETKLFQALTAVYERSYVAGYARNIVVISDGAEAKHGPRALEMVRANASSTRVSAVTAGFGVELFTRLSALSNGVTYEASNVTDIPRLLINVLKKVLVPSFTSLDVLFSYDGSNEAPPIRPCFDRLPVIAEGTRCFFTGVGAADLKTFVMTVSGLIGTHQLDMKVNSGDLASCETNTATKPGDIFTVSLAHTEVARQRIRELLDRNRRSCPTDEDIAESTRLSLQYGVLAKNTQLKCTGVDRNTDIDPRGRMVSAKFVPEKTTNLWQVPPPTPFRDSLGNVINGDASYVPKVVSTTNAEYFGSVVAGIVSSICSSATIDEILAQQNVDGTWELSQQLANAAGVTSVEGLRLNMPEGGNETAWATAIATQVLTTRFAAEGELSALALSKAAVALSQDSSFSRMVAAATGLISAAE